MAEKEKNTTKTIYEKLLYVQQSLVVPKDRVNNDDPVNVFHFRSAEQILATVKPLLNKVGATLTLSDEVLFANGRAYIKATATFTDITTKENVVVVALARESDSERGMSPSQVTGSASSYARKYALGGLFLLDDNKDPDEGRGLKIGSNETPSFMKDTKVPEPEKEAKPSKAESPAQNNENTKETPKVAKPEKKEAKTASGLLSGALDKKEMFTRAELEKTLISMVGEDMIGVVIGYYGVKSLDELPDEKLNEAIELKRKKNANAKDA